MTLSWPWRAAKTLGETSASGWESKIKKINQAWQDEDAQMRVYQLALLIVLSWLL